MRVFKSTLAVLSLLVSCQIFAQTLPPSPVPEIFWWKNTDMRWPSPRTDTLTLYIIGDIMSHQAQINSALRNGDPDYSTFLYHLRDEIASADLAIGNMEYTLAGPPYSGYPCFCAPDQYTYYLRDLGFDVLLTANNHILDKGYKGLDRTFRILDSLEGVQYTGISRNASEDREKYPLLVRVGEITIAIINFTYNTNNRPTRDWPKVNMIDRDDILAAINRARAAEADLILAFPHWGIEYRFRHNDSQESLARFMVENGVDAVIGGHPHFVQDMQWMGKVPVIYSLGDAVSNMDRPFSRVGLAVTLKIALESGKKPRILPPSYEFIWNSRPGEVEESFSALPISRFLDPSLWQRKDAYIIMKEAYETTRKESGIYEKDS